MLGQFGDDSIVVTWDYTDDASVIDYLVLISDTQFNDIGDAQSVGRTSVSNSFTITKQNFPTSYRDYLVGRSVCKRPSL